MRDLGGVEELPACAPRALDDPFSPARWTVVAVHVAFVVAGLLLAAAAAP